MYWSNDPTIKAMSLYSKDSKSNVMFDASRASAIYGHSETVQPRAVRLLPLIKL